MAQTFTDANFEQEVKKSDKLTLVDFWAPWCGPCQMTGPFVVELADEMGDQAKIGKLNVDENPNTAGEFNVMSIPTFLLFKNGEKVGELVGGVQKEALKAFISKHL